MFYYLAYLKSLILGAMLRKSYEKTNKMLDGQVNAIEWVNEYRLHSFQKRFAFDGWNMR